MSIKVILDINEEDMERLQRHAEMEQINIHDFILSAALRYVDQNELIDEIQLAEILENENLLD